MDDNHKAVTAFSLDGLFFQCGIASSAYFSSLISSLIVIIILILVSKERKKEKKRHFYSWKSLTLQEVKESKETAALFITIQKKLSKDYSKDVLSPHLSFTIFHLYKLIY